MDEIVFESLALIEVSVNLGGAKYVLREASGEAARQFRNARIARYEYNDEGKLTRVRDTADLESLLVSLCLFDAVGASVPEATIRSWPARVQGKLYDRAREIGALDETEDLETLEKQLVALQKQIEQLKRKGTPTKNS